MSVKHSPECVTSAIRRDLNFRLAIDPSFRDRASRFTATHIENVRAGSEEASQDLLSALYPEDQDEQPG